jgi:anti-sigma B factor antagonist
MNRELLTVTTRQESSAQVVRARGEVDMNTAALLEDALNDACHLATPHSSITVDLSAVTLFGTTGLGVLLTALGRCQAQGIPLRLIAAGPAVWRQLRAVGVARVFDPGGPPDTADYVA